MRIAGSLLGRRSVTKLLYVGGLLCAACVVNLGAFWLAQNHWLVPDPVIRESLQVGGFMCAMLIGTLAIPFNERVERRFDTGELDTHGE